MTNQSKKKIDETIVKGFLRRNIIEIAATLIALSALFLTIYQGIQARYHNRLSVLPHLQIEHSSTGAPFDYSILLRNRGMGPARITGIEVVVGNDFIQFNEEIDYKEIFNSLKKQNIADLDMSQMNFISFGPNAYVGKGEIAKLIELHPSASSKLMEEFSKMSKIIDFLFCYSSIYGDSFYVSRAPGKSNENSCRFDDTISIFGRKYRRLKNFPAIDTESTHGY